MTKEVIENQQETMSASLQPLPEWIRAGHALLGFIHIYCGLYVVVLVLAPLFFLPSNWLVALAVTDAVICLASFFYWLRFETHYDEQERQRRLFWWPVFGFLSIIIAVLLYLRLIPSGSILFVAKHFLATLFTFVVLLAFNRFISLLFPIASNMPQLKTEFSSGTRRIIETGMRVTYIAFGAVVLSFFVLTSVGSFIFRGESLKVWLSFEIISWLGFGLGSLWIIVARKRWQCWALRQGIPEAELRIAARLARIGWHD